MIYNDVRRKTKEISNRNSAGAESDSSIDLAIKEFVGAVGKAGRQYVMLSGMRSFRLSIENFMYAALLREYMRIETIIKHLLFICTQDMTQYLECKSPMSQLGGIR